MKKKRIIIFALLFLVTASVLTAPYIKCGITTILHGDEVIGAFQRDSEVSYYINGYSWARVLSYNGEEAEVYYINETDFAKYGSTVTYIKQNGEWQPKGGASTEWSTAGNADETVWPYWYHCIYFLFR